MKQQQADYSWITLAVFFAGLFVALCVHGCQKQNWTTDPEAYKTPTAKAKSVETATIGVRVDK